MDKLISFCAVVLQILIPRLAAAQNCDCAKPKTVSIYPLNIGNKPDVSATIFELNEYGLKQEISAGIQFPVYASTVNFGTESLDAIGTCINYFYQPESIGKVRVSGLGDYYTTGSINKSGKQYIVHYELRSDCSNKLVKGVDVTFDSPIDSSLESQMLFTEFTPSITADIVKKMGNLNELISRFELQQRIENANTVIEPARITLTAPKKVLVPGETIEVELYAVQCDGEPVKNTTFYFSKTSGAGVQISGTKGGTAFPAKLTTDTEGKAKFKFTKDNSPTAVIVAQAAVKTPDGCDANLFGSLGFGSMMKVIVHYEENTSSDVNAKVNNIAAGNYQIGNTISSAMMYEAVLYYEPLKKIDPKDILHAGTLIDVPVKPDGKARIHYVKEGGTFYYQYTSQQSGFIGNPIINLNINDLNPEGNLNENKFYFLSHPGDHHSALKLIWQPGFKQFFIEFNFKTNEKDKVAPETTAYVFADSKGAKFTKHQITDPASPYKTEYIINSKNDNSLGATKVVQTFYVQVLSPYQE